MSQQRFMNVLRWAAEECERQRSGERSVLWMMEGWVYARRYQKRPPTVKDVLALGRIVEPRHNLDGYRRVEVRVGFDPVDVTWQQVPRQMDVLMAEVERMDPYTFFQEYETIHPFRDGNGRTGAILYNWLLGTLGMPETAPEYDDRRSMRRPTWLVTSGEGF